MGCPAGWRRSRSSAFASADGLRPTCPPAHGPLRCAALPCFLRPCPTGFPENRSLFAPSNFIGRRRGLLRNSLGSPPIRADGIDYRLVRRRASVLAGRASSPTWLGHCKMPLVRSQRPGDVRQTAKRFVRPCRLACGRQDHELARGLHTNASNEENLVVLPERRDRVIDL